MDRHTLLQILVVAFIPCCLARAEAQDVAHGPSTVVGDTASLGCPCPWPGDMDGSAGDLDLADFAAFQRCFGLTDPEPACDEVAFAAADLRANHEIGLDDYAAFAGLAWPPPTTIECGVSDPDVWFMERCGCECLDSLGSDVASDSAVQVTPRYGIPNVSQEKYGVIVVRNPHFLDLLVDPTPLAPVDFGTSEVIVFMTPQAAEYGCWGTVHCFNGVVDLSDGRRAVVVGYVAHGPVICAAIPGVVTRAVVVPRSDRPVVMLFIGRDGEVTQTLGPICE